MPEDSGELVYNYKNFKGTPRPVIRVDLHYKRRSRATLALVDSGADSCIFSGEIGELLGINVKSGPETTIGGVAKDENGRTVEMVGYCHKIGITVKKQTRTITAVFSYGISDWGYEILGQYGFFDQFESVNFDAKRHKLTIVP